MITVKLMEKEDCCLCDIARSVLKKVQRDIPFNLEEIDISKDKVLYEQYINEIPVVFINGRKLFKYRVGEKELRKELKQS